MPICDRDLARLRAAEPHSEEHDAALETVLRAVVADLVFNSAVRDRGLPSASRASRLRSRRDAVANAAFESADAVVEQLFSEGTADLDPIEESSVKIIDRRPIPRDEFHPDAVFIDGYGDRGPRVPLRRIRCLVREEERRGWGAPPSGRSACGREWLDDLTSPLCPPGCHLRRFGGSPSYEEI